MRWGFVLLLLAIPSLAHADGAVAVGFGKNDTLVTTSAVSRSSAANARTRALADCTNIGRDCKIVHEFKGTCVATTLFNERQLDIGTGNTSEAAQQDALRMCQAKGSACTSEYVACDPAPVTAKTEPIIPSVAAPAPSQPPAPKAAPPRPPAPVPQKAEPISLSWLLWFPLTAIIIYAVARIHTLFTEKEVAPPRPDPSDSDRISARRHLAAAWDYVQKAITATTSANISTEAIEEIIGTLNLAAEHLIKAREFDPDTNIDTDLGQLTQPSLTGMLLCIEGGCEIQLARRSPFPYFGNRHLHRAVAALHQAIGYASSPQYYCNLAEAYALLGRTENAKEYVRKALDLDPEYIDGIQLQTAIPTMKRLHPPAPFFELKVVIFIAALAFTVVSFVLGYWYGVVPWIIIGVYYAARNELRHRLSSMWWTYSHYKHKKNENRKKQFIHTLHEKRWKGSGSIWHDI